MPEKSFLLIRLGSLGDIVHALPAAAAVRESFPDARIDWLVEPKWARILEGNPDIHSVIALNRASAGTVLKAMRGLRASKYNCAIDFQGLYKSSLMAFGSGAPKRVGFRSSYAREGLASMFYTDTFNPVGAHKVEHNLTLARGAGASVREVRFPLHVKAEDDAAVTAELERHNVEEFFVLNPAGGWQSKCWPAERYGQLSAALRQKLGWRGIVTYGPGEGEIAERVCGAAGAEKPVALPLALGPLMALLRRAKFVVSADTGPLHIAAALGAPVVGLFGPTDPARNGPYGQTEFVVRDVRRSETTYRRGDSYAASMLAITVEQVVETVEKRMRKTN